MTDIFFNGITLGELLEDDANMLRIDSDGTKTIIGYDSYYSDISMYQITDIMIHDDESYTLSSELIHDGDKSYTIYW